MTTAPSDPPRDGHLRRIVLVFHRYAGLAMAAFLVILAATGALLSFAGELDEWLNPDLYEVPADGRPRLDPLALRALAEAREPRASVDFVPLDLAPTSTFRVVLTPRTDPATGKPWDFPAAEAVHDPRDGALLAERTFGRFSFDRRDFISLCWRLHFTLGVTDDAVSKWLLGLVALAWTIDCLAALVLTLPPRRRGQAGEPPPRGRLRTFFRRWRPAWLVKLGAGFHRVNFDLHRAVSLWTWAVLLMFAWSGVGFLLRDEIYDPVMRTVFRVPSAPAPAGDDLPMLDPPLATPGLDWSEALATGRRLSGEAAARLGATPGPERYLLLDRDHGVYRFAAEWVKGAARQDGVVAFGAGDGLIKQAEPAAMEAAPVAAPLGERISSLLFELHVGAIGGLPWRVGITVVGLLILVVTVSGVIIWWKKRSGRRRALALRGGASALLLLALALALPVQALDPVELDLPAQPLGAALDALARQAGLQLAYTPADVAGRTAPAVSGRLDPADALARILAGTGLQARFTGERTVAVVPGPPARPATGAAPAPQRAELEEVAITDDREQGYAATAASTGTKTDTPLLETPLAVQVVPAQVLADQGVTFLEEALRNVSGVKASRNGDLTNENIVLRGFSSPAYLRDGVRTENNINFFGLAPLASVERVEVLKGPAAVLYGRGEPGGVVNLVRKQPREEPAYSVEQRAGRWNHFLTLADATGPVDEARSLLYRVVGSYDDTGTWVDRARDQTLYLMPAFTWRPGPRTSATATVEYTRNGSLSGTSNTAAYMPYDEAARAFVFLPRARNLIGSPHSEPITTDQLALGLDWSHAFSDDWSLNHKLERRTGKGRGNDTLVFNDFVQDPGTGAWSARRFHWNGSGWDATIASTLDVKGRFETAGVKHTLLLGADYARNINRNSFTFSNVEAPEGFSTVAVLGGEDAGPLPALDPAYGGGWYGEHTSYGLYAQDQVELPWRVHLLAGARYQRASSSGWSAMPAFFGGTQQRVDDQPWTDQAFTPRAGVLWRAADGLSLYGSYAENFGGANAALDWQLRPLPPESASQWEVGAKGEAAGGRLVASLALFDLVKRDVLGTDLLHASEPACVPDGCLTTIGRVRSRGVEVDLQGELLPGWSAVATYTLTDARIERSTNGDEGRRLANVPRHMASLWSSWERRQGALRGLKLGAGVTWRAASTDSTNTIDSPAYLLVDAMAAYAFAAGTYRTSLQLNVANLLDRDYYTDAFAFGSFGGVTWGPRRSVMVSLRVER